MSAGLGVKSALSVVEDVNLFHGGFFQDRINHSDRWRLSSIVKPDSNIAHHRESDVRARWRWLLVLDLGRRRLHLLWPPPRCIVRSEGRSPSPKRTEGGGRGRNNSADNKENDFTPRLLASSGFAAPYHNPFLACLVTWNMELFRLEPFKEGQANSCLDQSVDHRTKQHQA